MISATCPGSREWSWQSGRLSWAQYSWAQQTVTVQSMSPAGWSCQVAWCSQSPPPCRSCRHPQTVCTKHLYSKHTHTRLTALLSGTTQWAGTRKVKPIWILLEQEAVSGSGIKWAHLMPLPLYSHFMQVYTSLQTDNHASTPSLSFLQAGCPSCRPTNSVKAL